MKLQDEYVVRISVGKESLGMGRGEVEICPDWMVQVGLQLPAQVTD
jgi:hypothetical protein